MKWSAQAPSNIALIKYMGKIDHQLNLPTNPSLSFTLNHLLSEVQLTTSESPNDCWQTFEEDQTPLILSAKGQQRFLAHLARLKNYFQYEGSFIVRSRNHFPVGCGLASSASSFAALTRCAMQALPSLTNRTPPPTQIQAMMSRIGSGSSCRSFYSPWAIWDDNHVEDVQLPYEDLLHQVILIDTKEKSISSSEAHKLVASSPSFESRLSNVTARLEALLTALKDRDWSLAFKLVWDEFMEMHHLFQTASTPFNYITDDCTTMLNNLKSFWDKHQNGPLVTMDAGPNIHLLYRVHDKHLKEEFEQTYIKGKFDVI